MSQMSFTEEEIREWEEIELQKRKEDIEQYIKRGLPTNPRHEKWLQMRAAETRSIATPTARELTDFADNSNHNYILASTADPGEAHLTDRTSQPWSMGQSPANDGSFQIPRTHRPVRIDAFASPHIRTCAEDPEPLTIRTQATNGYSNAENTYLSRQSPPQDFGIPQSYSASASPPTLNLSFQQTKTSNCMYPPGRHSHKSNAPPNKSITHADKYSHQVSMYSPKSGNWHGLVAKLDSGSKENWIAQRVVDRLKLRVLKGTIKQYTTFNGEEVSSDATVKSTWCSKGEGNTHEHIFRVIEKAPFDVLFGTNLLDSDEIKWFSKTPGSDPVLVLTQKNVDKNEQEEIKRAEEIAKKESAILAKKSKAVKRDSKVPTEARKTSLKVKDPNKKFEEVKKDSRKIV